MAQAAHQAIFAELMSELDADPSGRVGRGYQDRLAALRRQTVRRLSAGAPREEAAALREIAAGLAAGERLMAAFRRREKR